jgi:uncharacterized protein (DUF58 family)
MQSARPTSSPQLSLPAEIKRLQLRSRRLVTGELLGQYRSAFKGTGLIFTDLRAYQPGDDVKHIHWKATARTGTVFVKAYEEDRQLRVILAVDTSSSMRALTAGQYGHTKALEFCAAVAALTQRGNDLLGLALFGETVTSFMPPATGQKRLQAIIAALTAVTDAQPRTNLADTITYLTTHARKSGVLFLISDFFAPSFEKELRTLCLKHDVILVQLETPVSTVLNCGLVTFTDAETGQNVVVDTNSKRVQEGWRRALTDKRQELKQLARSCGADHIVISDSATAPLIQLMRERAIRQPR